AVRRDSCVCWFSSLELVTFAEDRVEAFYDNASALRDYFRDIGRRVLAAEGRKANDSHIVFFFQAEDGIRDLTVTGVQTCALPISVTDALGLSEAAGTQDRSDPGQIVRRWLETDGDRCLLILDDVTDPEAVRPYLPAEGAARVVITSHQESDLGWPVPVGVFSAEEALAFLAKRTG